MKKIGEEKDTYIILTGRSNMVSQLDPGKILKKLGNLSEKLWGKAFNKPAKSNESKKEDVQEESRYSIYTLVRDLLLSVAIILLIFLLLYLYTRKYPPLVVVESGSMQHDEKSHLGVIDQGDLVLIKKVDEPGDIITWVEGKKKGYKTYGDYGDVIIYYKNGNTDETPIIHRAIVYIRYNESAWDNETKKYERYYDVPDWGLYHVRSIHYTFIQRGKEIIVHYKPEGPYDGYLTKGDNNLNMDQGLGGLSDSEGKPVEHVNFNWVDGVARGEIPWFGLIKLKLSHNEHIDEAPANSWHWLIFSIILIFSVPFIVETVIVLREKYLKEIEKLEEERKKRK